MDAKIESIQIGKIVTEGIPESKDVTDFEWTSAFAKEPVIGPVRIFPDRLDGDEFGNPDAHGGSQKAVLCYSSSHYETWQTEFPSLRWRGGSMGENLTIVGQDETSVCVGDIFAIGEVVVQVSQPRQPCWKINRFHEQTTLLKRVVSTGRTGWYLRVIKAGMIESGQTLTLRHRPQPSWSIATALSVYFGKDSDEKRRLFELPELSNTFR